MKLTEAQLKEIRNYLLAGPRYQETYNEIYDHIVNTLEDTEGTYNIDLVAQIIEEDFCSFPEIVRQEEIYRKQFNKKYASQLWQEALNTFKFPEVFNNLLLVLMYGLLYQPAVYGDMISKIMYPSIWILSSVPALFYLSKRYFVDRNFIKTSIKYDFLHKTWILGLLQIQLFGYLFVSKHSPFNLSPETRYQFVFLLYFLTSIYVRAFVKFYNKKISVLAV